MKKMILGLIISVILSVSANAYTIGEAYATLVSCTWGQYGYKYGNIGIYKVNGKMYQIFFGSNTCEY